MNDQVRIQRLCTNFLFPFTVDKEAVAEDHVDIWSKHPRWIAALEEWIRMPGITFAGPLLEALGPWRRTPYRRFDMDSVSYQDMVFFHPFVRRVFFDSVDLWGEGVERESLLHFYRISLEGKRLWFEAEDAKGRKARVEVTDLKLNMYANGIGTLSIGIEAYDLSIQDALWINEMMRKLYPSSGRQKREGRTPSLVRLLVGDEVVIDEDFNSGGIRNYLPPLSRLLTRLLYFAHYDNQEYEAVLDERMIVYTYVALDQKSLPPSYAQSDEYRVLISRVLYVDHWSANYRYDRRALRRL